MRERFTESRPENGLEAALKKRKNFFEKLVDSPYKWVLMSVLALEQQACAGLPRQVGWLGVEPNAVDSKYDFGYRSQQVQDLQPGSERESALLETSRGSNRNPANSDGLNQTGFTGPRAYLEFFPPNNKPSIDKLPEGFNGSDPGSIFAVAHGSPRSGSVAVTVPDERPWSFGEVEERQDLGVQSRMRRRPGVSDSDRLNEVMRTKPRPSDILSERESVAARAIGMLMPNIPNRQWGMRLEWQDVQRPDREQGSRLTISCRTSPWAAPSRESTTVRPLHGHRLEHDVLSDNQTVWATMNGGEPFFSQEKSDSFPQRPAQAAYASKPITLKGWNQGQAKLAELKRELGSQPKSEVSMSKPEIVRHRARVAELKSDIERLTRSLDAAFNEVRMGNMREALAKLLPMVKENELRFYVRFDEQKETLQVIVILDDPDISKI